MLKKHIPSRRYLKFQCGNYDYIPFHNFQLCLVASTGEGGTPSNSKKRKRWGSLRWSPFGRLPHEGWRWHPSLGCSKTIPSCEVVIFLVKNFSPCIFFVKVWGVGTLISGMPPQANTSLLSMGKYLNSSKFPLIPRIKCSSTCHLYVPYEDHTGILFSSFSFIFKYTPGYSKNIPL